MKRLFSRQGLREKVTLTVSVRALAIAIAVFALVVTFAIVGGYQGLQANHNNLAAQKAAASRAHAQRLSEEAETRKEIRDGFCDVVYYFDQAGVKHAPFIEHLRQVHQCDPASLHASGKNPPSAPGKGAPTGTGATPSPKGSGSTQPRAGGSQGPSPSPSPSAAPTPSLHPTPPPSPKPAPIIPVSPIPSPVLSRVCNLLDPLVGVCVTQNR